MFFFAPSVPLSHRGSATVSFRVSPLTDACRAHPAPVAPRAALRSGWGLRSRVERLQRIVHTTAVESAPIVPDAMPQIHATHLKRVSVLRAIAQRLVQLSRTLRAFRERHARALGIARLALGAIIGFTVLATRGRRGLALASTSGTSVAVTQSSASNALPSALSVVPDGVVRALRPFSESFGVVFLSEFGDKSMFATALMAMKHSPFLVLVGALAALTVMTLIACFLGQLMHLLPSTVTHYSSIALFVFFGFQMILQARHLPSTPGGKGGERADAEELLAESTLAGGGLKQNAFSTLAKISSLIFVAEWCDRSMIATMALAASSNSLAVVGGATLANVVCTGFAVGAAALVASRISERTVALIAGVMFEFFAVFTFLEGPES